MAKPHPKNCSLPPLFFTADDRDQPIEETSVPKDWGYAGPDQPHSMDEPFSSSPFSQEPGRGQAAIPPTTNITPSIQQLRFLPDDDPVHGVFSSGIFFCHAPSSPPKAPNTSLSSRNMHLQTSQDSSCQPARLLLLGMLQTLARSRGQFAQATGTNLHSMERSGSTPCLGKALWANSGVDVLIFNVFFSSVFMHFKPLSLLDRVEPQRGGLWMGMRSRR